jgi:hypothetical protein
MTNANTKKSVKNNQQKSSVKKQLTAKQIVNRHIKVKDDVITEEDMKHVKIDSSVPKDKAHRPLPISSSKKRPKDEDKDPEIVTPWDVINE